ncbi:hypothetical protein [Erythrobacter sp. THAF29]|uniref:hypothetical protein n=1 Tax=Erythrobacter sp. THAF29 TaxID=2587851 RepID=UPI0012697B7C|nr:hypothetical protein [Erythrobacter sp. THAF29]QFT78591.1 hypothetical protein FIU90_13660 [Erythrobacter sp. THAF29]
MKLNTSITLAIAALAAPVAASAHPIIVERDRGLKISPNNDSNSWWLDYKTDISEAERELDSDLRRATDEEDVRDAWEEYHREIADAKHDYRKEMRERGYRVANFRENRRRMARR